MASNSVRSSSRALGSVALNVGQVYTTLQRLERDGLAQSDDIEEDERQKNYRITEKGGESSLDGFARARSLELRGRTVIKVLVASRLANVDVYESSNCTAATSCNSCSSGLV